MQLQERILQLMKNSSDTLSLTYTEFSHIRNVITRAELENLLFNDKLYCEVAQGKLCFTCRKVYFNYLTFTFGIQCNVCKQKVCRNCVTQIALPKETLNDIPIQRFAPLPIAKSLLQSDRFHSLDTQSPVTPTAQDTSNHHTDNDNIGGRRCSTPTNTHKQFSTTKWCTEPIDICTDCFFLLQQIREKFRQRHVSPTITTASASSRSSSLSNRLYHLPSRSTSNLNLSSSPTPALSSLATLLAQQQQQQQRSLIFKANPISSNLKQVKSAQELSMNNGSLAQSTTTSDVNNQDSNEKVSLSRDHLFLKLQPTYDIKSKDLKT